MAPPRAAGSRVAARAPAGVPPPASRSRRQSAGVVFRRARCRCQACGRGGALEVHHVAKRAQGGSDFELDRLVALCPRFHAQTDAPTHAAGWSSPPSARGASPSRSPEGLISGRSARSRGPAMTRALGARRSQGAPGARSGDDPRNNRTPRDRGPARLGAGCADERGMVGDPAAGLAAS